MNTCELRGLNVPHGSDRERRAMIANELAEEWGERSSPMEFDFWELAADRESAAADGFNINVLAVDRRWVLQAANDCQRAHLDCWAVDGAPVATARAVAIAANLRGSARALAIDWGYSNVTLSVVGADRALYVRRIAGAGFRKCLGSIQAALGVTLEQAQYVATREGVALQNGNSADVTEIQSVITSAIANTFESVMEQVRRTLQFVDQQRRHLRPTSVWLLGGGASLRNIGPHVSEVVGLPVSIWGLPTDRDRDESLAGAEPALFANAIALSTLAWRAA
jgi:Tfp pilus assembly PilM family ATPase